jgi:hypothetical protein
LVGVAALSLIGFFLYKRNKRIRNEKMNIINYHVNNNMVENMVEKDDYHPGREALPHAPPPAFNRNINEYNYQADNNLDERNDYYPGQEIVTTAHLR